MKISKKKFHDEIIATAKEKINQDLSVTLVLAELVLKHNITLPLARKLRLKAAGEIKKDNRSNLVISYYEEKAAMERLNDRFIKYIDEDHYFTDRDGNPQEKDISKYYDLIIKNRSEKIKLIEKIAIEEDKITGKDNAKNPTKYEISGSQSPLFKDTLDLMNDDDK